MHGVLSPPLGQMSAGTAPWWQLSYMGMSLISVPPDWLLEKYPSVSFRNLTKIHLSGREIHGIKNDKYNCLCKQNCRSLQTLKNTGTEDAGRVASKHKQTWRSKFTQPSPDINLTARPVATGGRGGAEPPLEKFEPPLAGLGCPP